MWLLLRFRHFREQAGDIKKPKQKRIEQKLIAETTGLQCVGCVSAWAKLSVRPCSLSNI